MDTPVQHTRPRKTLLLVASSAIQPAYALAQPSRRQVRTATIHAPIWATVGTMASA